MKEEKEGRKEGGMETGPVNNDGCIRVGIKKMTKKKHTTRNKNLLPGDKTHNPSVSLTNHTTRNKNLLPGDKTHNPSVALTYHTTRNKNLLPGDKSHNPSVSLTYLSETLSQ